MKPLYHPSLEDITVEGILHALSDPVRVAIFARLVTSDSAHNCSTFLEVADTPVPKSTLSQHFKALREAGLIRGERRGNEVYNTSRCPEIEKRFPGLLPAIVKAHNIQAGRKGRAGARVRRAAPRG